MGIFDFIKKASTPQESFAPIQNSPEVLTTRLLYFERPSIDAAKILQELKPVYTGVESAGEGNTLLFFFPELKINLSDASIPAQLTLLNSEGSKTSNIEESSLQQNWHWEEATHIAQQCNYEIFISDLMSRSLDYKVRADLYLNFLGALIKVTNPQAIHSLNCQKLILPEDLVLDSATRNREDLHGLVNVRLFNINDGQEGEILMDTIGMHSLGLPDLQIKFTGLDENEVAGLLWNYAYYIYENGDVIKSGNTLQGLSEASKWKSEKQPSLVDPERIVINILVD
ncbi:DUF4261 domain-containing protein [Nibribacter koreensis]|uniref:DUF4261 domain-containing protein n=1 Tax=Nibribacter koreensis TaxID=1084519 RepID=A0ABP8FXY0_9BACT